MNLDTVRPQSTGQCWPDTVCNHQKQTQAATDLRAIPGLEEEASGTNSCKEVLWGLPQALCGGASGKGCRNGRGGNWITERTVHHQEAPESSTRPGMGVGLCLAQNRPRLQTVLLPCPVAWSDLHLEPRSTGPCGPGLQVTQV